MDSKLSFDHHLVSVAQGLLDGDTPMSSEASTERRGSHATVLGIAQNTEDEWELSQCCTKLRYSKHLTSRRFGSPGEVNALREWQYAKSSCRCHSVTYQQACTHDSERHQDVHPAEEVRRPRLA
ncbi:hypothetical protein E2C01_087695 [Portunus trituberculatus]|uniref:Uncharacterized protein n=1 Tax=Portunus trituberculatus TaxID=210409 RepID=A0A5B7JHZ4_PORTR|nr:hypothetical protein [Portunus trituberculatus]